MRSFFTALLVALAAVAGPAAAAPSQAAALTQLAEQLEGVLVGIGESVTLSIAPEGGLTVIAKGMAEGPGRSSMIGALDTQVEVVDSFRPSDLKVKPGSVDAALRRDGAGRTLLEVENGLDRPLLYEALIVVRQGQDLAVRPTTICPVRAGSVGVEAWSESIEAMILTKFHTPADTTCSGDTGLRAEPAEAPANVCVGGQDPVTVALRVDPATGRALGAEAVLALHNRTTPVLWLSFPMQQTKVAAFPAQLRVGVVVSLRPAPASKTAEVVVLIDGVEADRRPWLTYAQQVAAPPSDAEALFGVIPFALRPDEKDVNARTDRMLVALGESAKRVDVRVIGEGREIASAGFDLDLTQLRNEANIAQALLEAETKAAAPGHCAGEAAG